jgi:hypothetical protein
MIRSTLAMPHQPEIPANTRPAPTNAASPANQGDIVIARMKAKRIRAPAAI